MTSIKMPPKSKYYILGSNFGPYKTAQYLEQATVTFKNAQDVCFREEYSYRLFSELGNVRTAPDIVLGMDTGNICIRESKKVVISVIECKNRFSREICGKYENMICNLISLFIDMGYEIVLMSYCKLEGDEKAIESILEKLDSDLKHGITTYFYNGNIDEALNIMGDCEIVIASRFHANVLALLLNKTLISIAYSNKTINFLRDIEFKGVCINIQKIEKFRKEELTKEQLSYKYDSSQLRQKAQGHFEKLDKVL